MSETTHLSRQFDEDLERLRSSVLQMGGLVESQINMAIKAYAELRHLSASGKRTRRSCPVA